MYIRSLKRFAGICLLLVYLLAGTEAHNLLKIPVLIAHFREHRTEAPGMSFFAFIRLHYLRPVEKDADYQRDQQLPFRDADCCAVGATTVCECHHHSLDIQPPIADRRCFGGRPDTPELQQIAFDIFQPPRTIC